jgi:N-acetyl-anhydromuramyl-L-alanine amidase AmpD
MRAYRLVVSSTALFVLLAGCDAPEVHDPEGPPADDPAAEFAEIEAEFVAAAEEFDVPVALLQAIAFAETGWQHVAGEAEFVGAPPARGVMALRGRELVRAARLAGLAVEDVESDRAANIRAGAALLRSHADALGIEGDELVDWAPAVERLSGLADEEIRRAYVRDGVYALLERGVVVEDRDGAVVASLAPVADAGFDLGYPPRPSAGPGPDYAGSIWRPSVNYDARPAGAAGKVSMVVIHTCEGNYWGCWDWLSVPQSGVSAHYVVNETGSEISQLVREAHRAWHVSGPYNCNLNSGVLCGVHGVIVNSFVVGIEHAGFASQSSWNAGLIDASAKLTCDITKAWGVPRDKYHIVAHGLLQPAIRVDPGPNWPWTSYLAKVNAACGAATGEIIVDSNSANNDPARAEIAVSANWASANSTPGFYGTGYFHATTAAVSDGATFRFYLDAAAAKTIDGWWTAGTNRSSSAPFVVFDSQGAKLATVPVNQQVNGGKWVELGTYNFKQGWNSVVVSRWTTPGSVVIADAIRVR